MKVCLIGKQTLYPKSDLSGVLALKPLGQLG